MTSNRSNVLTTKEEVFKFMDIGPNDLVPGFNTPEDIFRSQFSDEDLEMLKLFNLNLDDISRLEDAYLVSRAYPAGFLTILSEKNLLEGKSNADIKDFTYGNVPSNSNFPVPCVRKEACGRQYYSDGKREGGKRFSNFQETHKHRSKSSYWSRDANCNEKYSVNSRLRRESRNSLNANGNSYKCGSGSDGNSPNMYNSRSPNQTFKHDVNSPNMYNSPSPNQTFKHDGNSPNMYNSRSPIEKFKTDRNFLLTQLNKIATDVSPISSNTKGNHQNQASDVQPLTGVEEVSSKGFRPVKNSQITGSIVVPRISPLNQSNELKVMSPVQDRTEPHHFTVQQSKPVPVNGWTELVATKSPLPTNTEGYKPVVPSEPCGAPITQLLLSPNNQPEVFPSSKARGSTNGTEAIKPDHAREENSSDTRANSYDVVFGDRDENVYYVRKKCDQTFIDEISRKLKNEHLTSWSRNPKEKVVVEVNSNYYRGRERACREKNVFYFKLVDVGWFVRIDACDVNTRVFQLPDHMKSLSKPIAFSIILDSPEECVVLKHTVASILEQGIQDGGKKVARVMKVYEDFQFAPIATPNALKLDERVLVVSSLNHHNNVNETGCMWVILQCFVAQYKEWIPFMKQATTPLQDPPLDGQFYLVTSSNGWNRVQVVSTQPLKLFYIDRGDYEIVHELSLKDFRVLPKEMSLVAPFAYQIRFFQPCTHTNFNEAFYIIPITVKENVYTVMIDEPEVNSRGGQKQQQLSTGDVNQTSAGQFSTQPTVKLNQSLIITATTQEPTVELDPTLTKDNLIEPVVPTPNHSLVNKATVDVNQTSVGSNPPSEPVSNRTQTSSTQPVVTLTPPILTDIDLNGPVTDSVFLPLNQPVQLMCTSEDVSNPDVKWMQPVVFDSIHGLSIHEMALDTSRTLSEEKNPPQVGQLCLSEFDGIWCRAKVVCSNPLTVFYIDYGNCDLVETVDRLKVMPEALRCIKPAACKVKFYHSGPPVECFAECTFTPVYMEEDVHVALRDREKEDARIMDRRIMEGQFVQLELGACVEVFWSQVDDVDVNCAWVQAATLFCTHLQECADIAEGSAPVKFDKPPRIGELCMKMFDDMFCRARVVSVNPLTVFYIDYGNCEEVSNVDELVQLPPSLHNIVPFAFKIQIPEIKTEYNVPGTDMMFTPLQVVRNLYIGQVTEKS